MSDDDFFDPPEAEKPWHQDLTEALPPSGAGFDEQHEYDVDDVLAWFHSSEADTMMTDPIDETETDDAEEIELETELDDEVSFDDVETPERPALKYYKRKAAPVEAVPLGPKPKWDDSVGIPEEYPRGSKGWALQQVKLPKSA